MDTTKLIESKINELDNDFSKLLSDNKLSISQIEDLAINSIEECKQIINNHIEELILSRINEKKLIIKKNKNGKKKDMN